MNDVSNIELLLILSETCLKPHHLPKRKIDIDSIYEKKSGHRVGEMSCEEKEGGLINQGRKKANCEVAQSDFL